MNCSAKLLVLLALVALVHSSVIDLTDYKDDIVDYHNNKRNSISNAEPFTTITWDDTLAGDALTWAEGCNFDSNGNGVHGNTANSEFTGNIGENIAWTSSSVSTAEERTTQLNELLDLWWDENDIYDYDQNTCNPGNTGRVCGHYKQMAWRNVAKIGCGWNQCTAAGKALLVCRYFKQLYGNSQPYRLLAWRSDIRCGAGYTAPNGNDAQCNPGGNLPCCAPSGWCGNTAGHCTCTGCVDYTSA